VERGSPHWNAWWGWPTVELRLPLACLPKGGGGATDHGTWRPLLAYLPGGGRPTVELGITFGLFTNGGRPTMGRGHPRYVARWGQPAIMDVSVGIKDISSLRLLFSTFINFNKNN
jgi:hypothetical protein